MFHSLKVVELHSADAAHLPFITQHSVLWEPDSGDTSRD